MTFIEGEYYVDRDNTQYIYVERRGGVTVFLTHQKGEQLLISLYMMELKMI